MPGHGSLPGSFWRFWAASTVSNLGDGVRIVALPLLAARLTDDPLVISGLVAMAFLPWVVVGPVSGAVVDRVDRRRLIVGVQLLRGAVALAFAAAVWSGTVAVVRQETMSIYAYFGVRGRREAVAAAHALGMLSPGGREMESS
jgi:MFS family permease